MSSALLVAPILVEAFSTSGTFAFVAALEASQFVASLFEILQYVFVIHTVTQISIAMITGVTEHVTGSVTQSCACCAHQFSSKQLMFA